MIYKGCIFLRFEVKQHVSALYGHHHVFVNWGFAIWIAWKGLRCGDLPSDYSSNMPMYRRVLCYTNTHTHTHTHIYIYIYIVSPLVEGFHPYVTYELCFWLPSHLSNRMRHDIVFTSTPREDRHSPIFSVPALLALSQFWGFRDVQFRSLTRGIVRVVFMNRSVMVLRFKSKQKLNIPFFYTVIILNLL